jgi:predicted metal-dependent phosphotriesterase family hydrolase
MLSNQLNNLFILNIKTFESLLTDIITFESNGGKKIWDKQSFGFGRKIKSILKIYLIP